MREIKFRAKVKEKGMSESWIEGSLVHITKTYLGEEDEQECDIYQIINEDGAGFFIDKDTVGQYTGLKDKNGKEIYEGDIVKVYFKKDDWINNNKECGYKNGIIEYCVDCFIVYIKKYKDTIYPLSAFGSKEIKYIEVIGNIYDNPKLLEV